MMWFVYNTAFIYLKSGNYKKKMNRNDLKLFWGFVLQN